MKKIPTVTVFGSCRVHTPCSLLKAEKSVSMNQQNIFGFVHYTREVWQQFAIITGATKVPGRLRPFLNIPAHWQAPEPQPIGTFHDKFQDTDLFVVEISSIRKLVFKAFFLQINRTREIIVTDEKNDQNWWKNLVRKSENQVENFDFSGASEIQSEIVRGLDVKDQTSAEIVRDLKRISDFLKKPVIFVSHFNTDYKGSPIAQRSIIAQAMNEISSTDVHFFDPTAEVLSVGLEDSLIDLGHYKPDFEKHIAGKLKEKIWTAMESQSREAITA